MNENSLGLDVGKNKESPLLPNQAYEKALDLWKNDSEINNLRQKAKTSFSFLTSEEKQQLVDLSIAENFWQKTQDKNPRVLKLEWEHNGKKYQSQEGLPVDGMIKFLEQKIAFFQKERNTNDLPEVAEGELTKKIDEYSKLRDILSQNSISFEEARKKGSQEQEGNDFWEARKAFEALVISQDPLRRSENPDNQQRMKEDWQKAEDSLKKRRELKVSELKPEETQKVLNKLEDYLGEEINKVTVSSRDFKSNEAKTEEQSKSQLSSDRKVVNKEKQLQLNKTNELLEQQKPKEQNKQLSSTEQRGVSLSQKIKEPNEIITKITNSTNKKIIKAREQVQQQAQRNLEESVKEYNQKLNLPLQNLQPNSRSSTKNSELKRNTYPQSNELSVGIPKEENKIIKVIVSGNSSKGLRSQNEDAYFDGQFHCGDNISLNDLQKNFVEKLYPKDSLGSIIGRLREKYPQVSIVCDGVGGERNGQLASALAQVLFAKKLADYQGEINQQVLNRFITEINNNIKLYAQGGATTLAATITEKNGNTWVVSVGDSRVYRYDPKEKSISLVTDDSSKVWDKIINRFLNPVSLFKDDEKNVVTQALGGKIKNPVPNIYVFSKEQLPPGSKLILCSDGVWEGVNQLVLNPQYRPYYYELSKNEKGRYSSQLVKLIMGKIFLWEILKGDINNITPDFLTSKDIYERSRDNATAVVVSF